MREMQFIISLTDVIKLMNRLVDHAEKASEKAQNELRDRNQVAGLKDEGKINARDSAGKVGSTFGVNLLGTSHHRIFRLLRRARLLTEKPLERYS